MLWNLGIRAWPLRMAHGLPRPIGVAPRRACACEGCFAWNGELGRVTKPLFAFEHRTGVAPVVQWSLPLGRCLAVSQGYGGFGSTNAERHFSHTCSQDERYSDYGHGGRFEQGAVAVEAARTGPDKPTPM
jgi:hypothetical protein